MSHLVVPTDIEERASWVQHQLRIRGTSLAAIARARGWSRRPIAMALRVPSFPQEQAIAEALGVAVETLFPERYDANGQRLHAVRPKNRSRNATVRRVDSAAAE